MIVLAGWGKRSRKSETSGAEARLVFWQHLAARLEAAPFQNRIAGMFFGSLSENSE